MESAQESAARWLKLDELCDRFEAACLSGAPSRVEEFLNDVPAERRDETIRELLKVDAHYRQKSVDRPSVAEYRSRFPDIDSLWLRTLLSQPSPRRLHESPDSLPARERFHEDPKELPVVPGYDVIELIGRGGMGVVYKARQFSLNRLVALKMVLAGELASPETLARSRAEARAVAQLQHPNLVQIYEVGDHHGRPYLAFEYVAGGSLDQRLRGNPQRPSAAARLIQTLAQAIQFAHVRGIVHRDLKPANILLVTNDKAPSSDSQASFTSGIAPKHRGSWLRGIAIVQSLLSEAPETIEALREIRNAVSQLAHIQSGTGRRDEADKSYRESIRLGQQVIDLASSRPDDHSQLANVLTNFALCQSSRGCVIPI